MQEHAGEQCCPGRDHLQPAGQLGIAEQHPRYHPETIGNGLLVLPELPKEGADAHADQEISDDRRPPDRIIVVQREGENHARLLFGGEARMPRIIMRHKRRRAGEAQRNPPFPRPASHGGFRQKLHPSYKFGEAAAQVPTRPNCGLDGSAKLRFGMRPASRARRPALAAARIAAAIRRGSCDLAIAVLAITASQPSSIANAASDAVPMPASSTTGTGLRVQISSIPAGLAIPIPEPISEPNGITAAQPTSASFWQATGSSLQ